MSKKSQSSPLTPFGVYRRLSDIHEIVEDYPEEWRVQVAKDLNVLIGRATYEIETCDDQCNRDLAAAVLRIVERVAESEGIKVKGKPSE